LGDCRCELKEKVLFSPSVLERLISGELALAPAPDLIGIYFFSFFWEKRKKKARSGTITLRSAKRLPSEKSEKTAI
jgi:hypothetical protein